MKNSIVTVLGAAALATSAHASFDGFTAIARAVNGNTIVDVFAVTSSANHKLYNVYDAQISTTAIGGFYQAAGVASKTWKPDLTGFTSTRESIDSFMTIGASRYGLDHSSKIVFIRKWSCCIVHADDRRILWHSGQTTTHRLAARCTACDTTFTGGNLGRQHDDHTIARLARRLDRPVHDTPITECFKLLRSTKTTAGSCRNHDGPNNFAGPAQFTSRHRRSG